MVGRRLANVGPLAQHGCHPKVVAPEMVPPLKKRIMHVRSAGEEMAKTSALELGMQQARYVGTIPTTYMNR